MAYLQVHTFPLFGLGGGGQIVPSPPPILSPHIISLLSLSYSVTPKEICLMLFRQVIWCAFSRDLARTGKRRAAKIAMMTITTRSSISVNPVKIRLLTFRLVHTV